MKAQIIEDHDKNGASRNWFFGRSDIGDYMRRWLLRTPWFTLRIHNILRSDKGRIFHDHPWDFLSIILGGKGYREWMPPEGTFANFQRTGVMARPRDGLLPKMRTFGHFSIIRHKAEDLHRLELDGPAWTFVITGPLRRMWGFAEGYGKPWTPWTEYKE